MNPNPQLEGLTKIVIPDSISTRQILEIVHWLGSDNITDIVETIVNGNDIYFKHEDDAVVFRLRFGV